MRFEERVHTGVSPDVAWEFLWQPQRLAACLPGCVGVQEIDPGHTYSVQVEDRVGPYKVHFDMRIEVEEIRDREYVRLRGTGQDKALGASQQMTLSVTLEPHEADTELDVVADIEVLGKIATLGQFVIKRKAKDVITKFAQNIQDELRKTSGASSA